MKIRRKLLAVFIFLTALSIAGHRGVGANGHQAAQDRNDKVDSSAGGFDGVVRQNV
jgi:hypothetical protein